MPVPSKRTDRKPEWRQPAVQELGNLRDFVRTGAALGKSVLMTDGASMAGNESMAAMD
jgi:hypothetical protein